MGIDMYVKKDGEYIYFEGLGSGTNFYEMRLAIQHSLENGVRGSRFPVLQTTPSDEVDFTIEQAMALREEIKTIVSEKDNLQEEYKNIPYRSHGGEPPTRDFTFSREAILDRLEVILKGCEVVLDRGGVLGWVY